MSDAPKLLTEAEWRLHYADFFFEAATLDRIIAAHRQRGLIAPEPDKLAGLRRALNAATEYFRHEDGGFLSANDITVLIEAVRPFLAKPELTREMVRRAVDSTEWHNLTEGDITVIFTRLHAALINPAHPDNIRAKETHDD